MNRSQLWIITYREARLSLNCLGIFQCNYILSLALFFKITLIREYIIQHQDMKEPLQQSYRNIAHGSKTFI